NIDQFAHLGGLIGGLLCGMLLGPVYSDRQYWEIAPQRRRPVERTAAALVLLVLISAGLNPMRAAGWLRAVVPAAAEAMEARYGRFFTPFVATTPAVLWVDPDLPDSDWRFVESTLSLPDGPPVAFGVFWRWTRGGGAEEQSTYRVVWERRPHAGEAWTYVGEETGGGHQNDD